MSPSLLITQPTHRARSWSEVEANDSRLHSRGSSEQVPGDSDLLGMESTYAPPRYLTGDKVGIAAFVDNFDVFLFDCDGVLWSGDHVFPGVVEALEMFRSKKKRILFVTNNSTKSRAAYREKLTSMGIPCTRDEIFGSAYASALYISLLPSAGTTFVIGSTGLETELASLSLPFIGGTSAAYNRAITAADYPAIASGAALDPAVDTVLVGLDQSLGYLKYAHAFAYLQRGARFLATNGDSTLPSAGALFPGAGSCCAPLVKMSGREPEIMGKPSGRMLDVVLAMLQRDGYRGGRSRLCMIGDRLDTDIRFGIDGGLGGTLAVLTGVSRREEWEREGAEVVPGYYVDALADLNGPSSAPLSS